MKMIKNITAAIAILITTMVYGQKKEYTIVATIKDVPNGKEFYLVHNNESGRPDTISKTNAIDGKFKFIGQLDLEGEFYFIKMDTASMGLPKGKKNYCALFLDHSDVQLTGSMEDWPEVIISGSKPTNAYKKLVELFSDYSNTYNLGMRQAKNDSLLRKKVLSEYQQRILDYVKLNPNFFTSAYIASNQSEILGVDKLSEINGLLSDKVKRSFYGQQLEKKISAMQMQANVSIGKIIPEFYVTTPDGLKVSIKDLARKSSLTLVDFWAYWCKPCRDDIPNMKKVYQEFKDKGFNIVSVSTDPNIPLWKKALAEEGTPWINGMAVGKPSKDIFGLQAIPGYLLLNEKAEILALDMISPVNKPIGMVNGQPAYNKKNGLRGEELNNAIARFLNVDNHK